MKEKANMRELHDLIRSQTTPNKKAFRNAKGSFMLDAELRQLRQMCDKIQKTQMREKANMI